MKKKAIRRPVALCLCLTALLISSVIVYDLSENLFASHQARTFSLQLDNIVTTLSSVTNVSKKAYESYADNQRKNLELSRELLKSLINAEGYEGPLVFEDGFVVSCKDGQIIYPQSETAFPKIDVSMLERPGEVFKTTLEEEDYTIDVQVVTAPLNDELYFIDVTDQSEVENYLSLYSNEIDVIRDLEDVYKGKILLYSEEAGYFSYISEVFYPRLTMEEFGINKNGNGTIILDGVRYNYASRQVPDSDQVLYYLTTGSDVKTGSFSLALTYFMIVLIILGTAVTFAYAVQDFLKKHRLSPAQQQTYAPARVRKICLAFGLIGLIVVLLVCGLIRSMTSLYLNIQQGERTLDILKNGFVYESRQQNQELEEECQWQIYYGEKIAALAQEHEQVLNKNTLKKIRSPFAQCR